MNKFKNILEKLVISMTAYAADDPPPSPETRPGSIPKPSRRPTAPTQPAAPPPTPPPTPPPGPLPNLIGCDGQPIENGWPSMPRQYTPTYGTAEEYCSQINRQYTALKGHLSACKGNCISSDDPEYDFENCLLAHLAVWIANKSAGGSILHKSEGVGPPEQLQPARIDQTLQRNCIINKVRCNCEFNERKFSFLLEQGRLASLYANGCKPFARASTNNWIEANKAEEARKKRFKIACADLKKDYPSSDKCHKGATGKHTYGKACAYICTKCGETRSVVP